MKTYRFRATLDDEEDIYREIEVKANQTLQDLFSGILQAYQFDNIELGVFHHSNDAWEKGKAYYSKEGSGENLMQKARISDIIYDPHQKFLFFYDEKVNWTFFVELFKIVEEDAKATYPRCVKVNGDAPVQRPSVKPISDDEIEADFDDLFGKPKKRGRKPGAKSEEAAMADAIDDLLAGADEDELPEDAMDDESYMADADEEEAETDDDADTFGFNEDELDGFGAPDDYKEI